MQRAAAPAQHRTAVLHRTEGHGTVRHRPELRCAAELALQRGALLS